MAGEPPGPGPFQRALLDKGSLTYADYESAMQAMAQCMQDRVPGATVALTPSQGVPGMLDVTVDASEVPGSVDVTQGSVEPSPGLAVEPSEASTGSGDPNAPEPEAFATKPPNVVASDVAYGECQLVYSAFVADKWWQQQVLDAGHVEVQKPQFLQCMTAAGVAVPTDTSDTNLGKWLGTPAWFDGLTRSQIDQANQCLQQYSGLVNTVSQQ